MTCNLQGSPLFKLETGSWGNPPHLHIVCLFRRKPLYYLVNVQLLMFGIAAGSVGVWSIPVSEGQGDRLALDFTLLLVAVAFKQVVNGDVPPLSYLTILDCYLLGC